MGCCLRESSPINLFSKSGYNDGMTNEEKLEQIRKLSKNLDTKFKGPLGTSFGLDALIGLIPGIGDFITSAYSIYIVMLALSIGVSSATLLRMGLNILIDNVFDMIPFLGNVFDFYWKSNAKNLKLLEAHLADPARETIRSRMVVAVVAIALVLLLVLSAWATFKIFAAVISWISMIKMD